MFVPTKTVLSSVAAVAIVATAALVPSLVDAKKGGHAAAKHSAVTRCEKAKTQEARHIKVAVRLTDKVLTKLDAKSTAAQTKYQDEVVAEGGEIENYEELVATVDTKRAAVLTAKTDLQGVLAGINCATSSDRAVRQAVHGKTRTLAKAVHSYQHAVTDLKVAVNDAVEALPEPTPEPSVTPTP